MSCHSLFFLRKTMNLALYTCSCRSISKIVWTSLQVLKPYICFGSLDILFVISRGGSTTLLYSFRAISYVMVSMTLGASGSCFIGVNFELSSLVLRNKSHPHFLVGSCTRPFLQVKCLSCMVRTIS